MWIEASERPGCPFFCSKRVHPLGFSVLTWSWRLQFEPRGSSLGVKRVDWVGVEAWGGSFYRLGGKVECGREMFQERRGKKKKNLPSRTPELKSVSRGTFLSPSDCGVPARTLNEERCCSRQPGHSHPGAGIPLLPGQVLGSRAGASYRAHPAALQCLKLGWEWGQSMVPVKGAWK